MRVGGSRSTSIDASAAPLATLLERAVGRAIDAGVLIAVQLLVMVPFSLLLWFRGWGHDWGYGRPGYGGRGFIEALHWLIPAAVALAWVLYETVSTCSGRQTPGKRVAGIATVRASDGSRPPAAWSAWRALLPAMIGADAAFVAWKLQVLPPLQSGAVVWMTVYLTAVTNGRRRGWHDMLAGTVVVRMPA